ncbi:hypothetical protein FRC98_17435 [Lujinxingia vulgaris]|uniref:Uncharacterized protein n=1 Tax=Lujinxingia vulgaris TaxID=2600176 RepID=A0A5C6XBZ1_9DELT|nr:hypothetical protein [Lujinxingia vulgaris]TXD34905.1 hypothetical protein FRC98_17435 [Lujinxingia vulgaris]
MKTMKMTTLWWCVSAMVWTIAACGGGDGQTQQNNADVGPDVDAGVETDVDVEPPPRACAPDPDLLAERTECLSDDMCPCGTFCSLGLCTYECTADTDCAEGQVCGRFGTCRAPEDEAAILPPTSSPTGKLKPEVTSRVMSDEGIVEVELTAETDLDRARISARGGAQVRCPGDADFADECILDALDLEAGDVILIEVRLADDADPGEVAELVVIADNSRHSVSLPTLDQLPGHLSSEEIAALAAPLQGRYRGSLRLVDAGARQGETLRETAVIPLAMEVDAILWESTAGEAIIQINDPLNVLSVEAGVIGSLTYDTATGRGSASLPITRLIESTVGGQTSAINVETTSAEFLTSDAPRTISLAIDQQYIGSGATAPTVSWALNMVRVSDVTDPAPSPQADASLGYNPAVRLLQDTPYEATLREILERIPASDEPVVFEPNNLAPIIRDEAGFPGEAVLPGAFIDQGFNSVVLQYYFTSLFLGPNRIIGYPSTQDLSITQNRWNALLDTHPEVDADESRSVLIETTELDESLVGGIPCELANMELTFMENGVTRTSPTYDDDFCDTLTRVLGCQLEDVAVDFDTGQITVTDGATNSRYYRMSGSVSRTCRFAYTFPSAAELPLCATPPQTYDQADWEFFGFENSLDPVVGDLGCRGSELGMAFPLDLNETTTGSAMLDACLEETMDLAIAPGSLDGLADGELFLAVVGPESACVNVPRVLMALALQSRALRLDADDLPYAMGPEGLAHATAVTNRLMTRWIQLHAYFANEADQQSGMAAALSGGTNPVNTPSTEALYEASLQGWDLLFSPHVIAALMETSGAALQQPDYRVHRYGTEFGVGSDPSEPVASAILDALARQAKVGRILLEDRYGDTVARINQPVAELLPRLVVAQAVAADLHRRALTANPNLRWSDAYFASATRASKAAGELLGYRRVLLNGENPLGIDDDDLPLYFNPDNASGPSGRFGVISDFLLGTSIASTAWAPVAVAQAEASLSVARAAFIDQQDRRVREAHNDRDFARWVEDVRDEYEATLRDYCGPLGEGYIDDPFFDPTTCYVASDVPACSVDFDAWYRFWTDDDLMGRFCLHAEYNADSLSADAGFSNAAARTFAQACFGERVDDGESASVSDCAGSGSSCLVCDHNPSVAELPLSRDTLNLTTPRSLESFLGDGENSSDASVVRVLMASAISTCRADFPTMNLDVPLPNNPREEPDCLTGTLGEANLEIVAATRDLEQAREAIAEHTDAYDVAMRSCWILEEANSQLQAARNEHLETMRGLREAKAISDGVATVAAGVKECAATAASSDKSNPIAAVVSAGTIGASCAAGAVETVANVISIALEADMENAQARHDNLVAELEAAAEFEVCANDARMELVGLRTAAIEVERAAFDLQRANATLFELTKDAERAHAEGFSYLERIEGMEVPDASGDIWVNEKITTYTHDFKTAQRAAYLAVRAVEYEYQASLAIRQAVFDAKTPMELRQNVLEQLWADANTRGINGSMPTELNTVVSLRDDILQLGDASLWPESLGPLTPAERFRILLSDERFSVYEGDTYQGQRIPFTLAPLGALGFETRGVPIFSQNDCAERLWAINASVLGEDLYIGSETQNVRIDLLKRNTFFSQWCGASPDGQPDFQLASVRPSRNLFRVPGIGADFGQSQGGGRGVEDYSRARIQAFFNVDRGEFEGADYASGQTAELAARGLYGDYAIFIPASVISVDGSNGLNFNSIDDILLRLDYVSVAR